MPRYRCKPAVLSAPLAAFAKETFVLFPRELNPAPSRCVLPD